MRKFAAMAERATQICAAVAAFVFLASGTVYLYLGRWPVPAPDFWIIYDFCLNHTWLESALVKHNGHSLFFPSFIWLADLRFFHGDEQLLFFAGLALLLATALLLLIPVWRDKTASLTAKTTSTLVIIVGNFWMARATITSAGGFNCINSLAMGGAALAFLLISKTHRIWATMPIIVCAGFLSSFSFGAGLAIWPTLLLLAWCLCLPWRSVVVLCVGALATIVIYELLPPLANEYLVFRAAMRSPQTAVVAALTQLCRLVGSPIFYASAAWCDGRTLRALDPSFKLALWSGMIGLALAGVAIIPREIHRDLGKSSLEITGLSLMIFNVLALIFVVGGRLEYFLVNPADVAAPRYLFWSSLFWTGLLLIGIGRTECLRWGRWLIIPFTLASAVFVWPAHYQAWFYCKSAQCWAEEGATTLINGVFDDRLKIFSVFPNQARDRIARLTPQLRARRLDMFADGLQDWIGRDEGNLFGGRHRPGALEGHCQVDALAQCDNGAPAARVSGQVSKNGQLIPRTLVIVDPNGVIRGVARSAPITPFINRVFYLSKLTSNIGFLGYIREYDPQLQYVVRSADDGVLSEEAIPVRIPPTKPVKP